MRTARGTALRRTMSRRTQTSVTRARAGLRSSLQVAPSRRSSRVARAGEMWLSKRPSMPMREAKTRVEEREATSRGPAVGAGMARCFRVYCLAKTMAFGEGAGRGRCFVYGMGT
jgi:hypothetical protein